MDLKLRLLIIEDDPYAVQLFTNILKDEYELSIATSYANAFELFQSVRPHLILTDIMLPNGPSGLDLLSDIKSLSPETLVITISALGYGHKAVLDSLRGGAFDFIAKPIKPSFLLHTLKRAADYTRSQIKQRQIEQHLKESEEKYRLLTEHIKDVVFSLSLTGEILNISGVIKEFSGHDPSTMICTNIEKYFSNIPEGFLEHAFIEKIVAQKSSATFTFDFLPRGREPFPVECIGSPLVREGKVISIQCSMRDISERQKNLREKRELEKQLYQAAKLASIGELAAGIAHEINNPLTIIMSYAEKIEDIVHEMPDYQTEVSPILAKHQLAVERIQKITEEVKTFSRINEDDNTTFDLHKAINEAIDLVRLFYMKSGIHINVHLDAATYHTTGHSNKFQQVMLNLLSNAKDSTLDKNSQGTIEIRTVNQENSIIIEIQDYGRGIASEHLNQIFKSFFYNQTNRKGYWPWLKYHSIHFGKHAWSYFLLLKCWCGHHFYHHITLDNS